MSSFEFYDRIRGLFWRCLLAVALFTTGTAHGQTVRQTILTDEAFVNGETLFWTPGIQKCWDETAASIGRKTLPLRPETKYVKHLNSFNWDYDQTVPRDSHVVIVTGAGEEFREKANQILLRHFGRSVPPLEEDYFAPLGLQHLGSPVSEMIILSLLKHDLVFEKALKKYPGRFGFHSKDGTICYPETFGSFGEFRKVFAGTCDVLRYNEEGTEFALSFSSNEKGEKLIFVQSPDLHTIGQTIEKVRDWRKAADKNKHQLSAVDTVLIPSLKINHYENLMKYLTGVIALEPPYFMSIARAGQRIQLSLDEKGSSMNTASYVLPATFISSGGGNSGPIARSAEIRKFLFNKPFQMMVWKEGADIPFFFGRIDTSALKLKDP